MDSNEGSKRDIPVRALWLYHSMSALKAAVMRRSVLQQLSEDESWPVGWVFDGRKNIYAPLEFKGNIRRRFIGQDEQSFEVCRH